MYAYLDFAIVLDMIRAVVLDFDDTLCMTEAVCFEIENEVLRQMNRPPMDRAVHQATWGQQLFEAITVRSPDVDVEEFKTRFPTTMQRYIDEGLLDQVPSKNFQALDELLAANKQLIILTSRQRFELAHMLEPDHELARRVSAFYYRENMQYHKPDPRAFEVLLHEHRLEPHEVVYVGDSPSDAAAATKAGLHFIATLESGMRSAADFAAYPVAVCVTDFPQVVAAIRGLDAQAVVS